MAGTPNAIITPQVPRTAYAVAVAAKVTLNDLVNAVVCFTAGLNGSRITRVRAMPRMTVTVAQLLLLTSQDGIAGNLRDSALLQPYTLTATTAVPVIDFGYSDGNPLFLRASEQLWVGCGVAFATGVQFIVEGADY
jgi:hypothetical protein